MTEPRTYDVVALPVPIAYNAYGDHDRHGTVFALARHEQELRALGRDWPEPFPDAAAEPDAVPEPDPLVRPLVLRARVGERVVVHFRNELRHRAGIHPQGVRYDVERADGGVVGANPDSAADPGGRRRYVWDCVNEGVFFFGDLADLRGTGCGSQAHGLFGALVVEPAGATWTDPETGDPVEDGLSADVHVPGGPGFREYVLFLQDGVPNDAPGGAPDGDGRAVGYRAEPAHRRTRSHRRLIAAGALDPVQDAVAADEQRYSSWLFGDPATPVLRAYAGDRARIRLVHAGMSDTHVFGLDGHRWHSVPGDPRSPVVDAVGIGPQQAVTVEPIGGAGSVAAATGDVAWHGGDPDGRSGAWGIWRMFDVDQDGTGRYPDGTPVRALRALPGHTPPPAPTAERPGFPAFVPGEYPQRAPRPPRTPSMPDGAGREPTALERAAFCPDPQPGEAFTKVAPAGAPVRRHHLVAMAAALPHFRSDRTAWTDPDGVLFAPAADVEAAGGVSAYRARIESGRCAAAPVVLRAAAGEVVELSLTNALPPGAGPGRAFQPECGVHPHLVGYDPLVADGASVGWNYLSGATTPDAGPDHGRHRTWTYRWYCDEEFGTVVLGDGVAGGGRRRHGLFGCLVVEPAGSRWTDPHDPARPAGNASAAVVTRPDGTAFREQVLAVADRVPLVEHRPGEPAADGSPVTPDGRGTTTVGYRCEPLSERPGDPADWFSSTVHDDPGTPLVRGYPGEELRIRLHQGADRDQHSFVGHGLTWPSWPGEPASPRRNQRTLGPGQAFDLHVGALPGPGDRLWSLAAVDDTWLGGWGLVRLHDAPVADLPPLPGAFPAGPAGTGVPDFDPTTARRHHVRVRAGRRRYSGSRADPLALVCSVDGGPEDGPLVLRARAGEWVEVTLTNELSGPPPPAEADPPLPGKDRPGSRTVSDRVSLQAAALDQDVRDSDGAFVGRNPDTTAKPGHSVTYRWYCATPGAVLLTDRADVRTHRHRGLVGALVVEPPGATPYDPNGHGERWTGEQAVLRRDGRPDERELVLLLTDGVRLYSGEDTADPVPDLGGGPGDGGQKAFNHRSAHLVPERPSLADARPPTPLLACAPGDALRLHLVVAGDRPRPHSFTVHGHDWPVEEHLTTPRAGATGGLAAGAVRSLALTAGEPGDYAYRTGALRWALAEGLWGLLRVRRP